MGHIKIDELSTSLKEYIANLGLTEEQVNELIQNVTGDMSTLQTTEKTVAGAINELFQSANNGKELIATAIGEPLVSTDTFNAMSGKIDGLNSSFKTALMNNGVSVESSDKFKQLIEKLALLADSEGKGIQYATGTYTYNKSIEVNESFNIPINLDFVPTIVFVVKLFDSGNSVDPGPYSYVLTNNNIVSFLTPLNGDARYPDRYKISSVDSLNITITLTGVKELHGTRTFGECTWYAIGVGEEDTTLEDSLRDILSNKGVEVSAEDDLASLITKVDNIDIHQPLTGSNIIYDNGTINTELTGGLFLARPYSGDASCTFETDHIYVYPGANSSTTYLKVFFRCRHPFSVYGYNKIKLTYATRNFTKGGLTLQTEVYNWVSASSTSHDYTKSNPDSVALENTGGSGNITETILEISDNTVPINIAICLEGSWSSSGVTQAGIYIHKIELLK